MSEQPTITSVYIERTRNNTWRIRARYSDGSRRQLDSGFTHEQAAREAAKQYTTEQTVLLVGDDADDPDADADVIWNRVIDEQQQRLRTTTTKRIILPAQPVAIAFLSDFHLGNPGTDYASVKRDAQLVAETDGMYAMFIGDGIDNWIIPKLAGLQRGQAVTFDEEWLLLESWLSIVAHKLLVVVAGNHDNWTTKLAGIDRLRDLVKPINVLYHHAQVVFLLQIGDAMRTLCIRHKWRGNSIFNATHGLEVSWERMGVNYDWSIGGHTHIDTVCRPFLRHGVRRHAILIGTYKLRDTYGVESGYAPSHGSGSGAMVIHPDGRQWWFDRIDEAAMFVLYLRHTYQQQETA